MKNPEIIYEDDSIIIINKPAAFAVQSADISQMDCVSFLKSHLKKDKEPYLGIVHRLDQPVAGLLVFAKNEKSAAILSKQVQSDMMDKVYLAKVEGFVQGGMQVLLCDEIYKDNKNSRAIIVRDGMKVPKDAKVKKAELEYIAIDYDDKTDVSTLRINLKTGRFHQIRAQLSNMNHPILGDVKYGSKVSYETDLLTGERVPRGAIALRAGGLSFIHPVTKEKMIF